jgi:hypothetical protein
MLAHQAGAAQSRGVTPGVRIEMGCEVERLESRRDDEDPSNPLLRVRLTSGEEFSVDMVVVAAGVVPSVEWCVCLSPARLSLMMPFLSPRCSSDAIALQGTRRVVARC